MAFLPDTNVWIRLLKEPGGNLERRIAAHATSEILLCSIVKAELWHGAQKYGNRERRLRALAMLFAPFASLAFDDAAARAYGEIRHSLESQGALIGPNDLKIAAIARANHLTLVSAGREFCRVPALQVADWT